MITRRWIMQNIWRAMSKSIGTKDYQLSLQIVWNTAMSFSPYFLKIEKINTDRLVL